MVRRRRRREAMSETPGTPQTPATSVPSDSYKLFEVNVREEVWKKVRGNFVGYIREEKNTSQILTITRCLYSRGFTQHYVTQIIHTHNTLCNSCWFWINCSLFWALFLCLFQHSESSGILHPAADQPVVFSGWHWGWTLQQQSASLTLWYMRPHVPNSYCTFLLQAPVGVKNGHLSSFWGRQARSF